jgi:hypothetical protein
MRALRFRRRQKHNGKLTPPGVTTFFRILNEVDEQALELALLAWQDQVLGPVQDRIIAVDGKKLRHSQGGELVSAVGAQSGRWLGTVRTPDKTNEITAARTLLERLSQREELSGKVVVLDALHTHQETARLIVQELGADYLFTVKANQETMHKTVSGLLSARSFPPSGSGAPGADGGEESGTARATSIAPPGHNPGAGLLCGGPSDRGTLQHDEQKGHSPDPENLAAHHQCRSGSVAGPGVTAVSSSLLGD